VDGREVDVSDEDEYGARPIFRAWLEHCGYTAEQIAEIEADRVHTSDCELTEHGWECFDEDLRSFHRLHDDTDEAAELVMFTLDALSAAGRLLPEGGEERTEWSTVARPTNPRDICQSGPACPRAREHQFSRTVRTFPDGSEWINAWTEVTE
jgi:hypothetical protein